MWLKGSCFPDCWKVSSVERSTAKKVWSPASLLCVVSKVFEILIKNNRLADRLETGGPFSDFQYGFRLSRSTTDLLAVVSDRFARAFNRVWRAGFLHKLKSCNLRSDVWPYFVFSQAVKKYSCFGKSVWRKKYLPGRPHFFQREKNVNLYE